jgi:hypothetical protein
VIDTNNTTGSPTSSPTNAPNSKVPFRCMAQSSQPVYAILALKQMSYIRRLAWKNNGTPFIGVYGIDTLSSQFQSIISSNSTDPLITSNKDTYRLIQKSLNDWNCLISEIQHCSIENFKQLFPGSTAQPQRQPNHRIFRVKSAVVSSSVFKSTPIKYLCVALRSFEDMHDTQMGIDWIEVYGADVNLATSNASQPSMEDTSPVPTTISLKRFRIPSFSPDAASVSANEKRMKENDIQEALKAQKSLKALSRSIDVQ